jgi:hypothetical protein
VRLLLLGKGSRLAHRYERSLAAEMDDKRPWAFPRERLHAGCRYRVVVTLRLRVQPRELSLSRKRSSGGWRERALRAGEPIKSRCGSWICTVAISPPPP